MIVIIALALANSTTRYGFQPISAKFNRIIVGTDYEYEKWNSFSRITASHSRTGKPFLWGKLSTLPYDLTEERRYLAIDGLPVPTCRVFQEIHLPSII